MQVTTENKKDEELLAIALKSLEEKGFIEYFGEYGNEIATFVPFVAWLKQEGLLSNRRVITFNGMRPYYFFLDDSEFEAKHENRKHLPPKNRPWPSSFTHTATRQRWHVFHDYRAHFRNSGRNFEKPVLFIQNKFNVEDAIGPINYLPLGGLDAFLSVVENRFHVVYSRPGIVDVKGNYSHDAALMCTYPDLMAVRKHEKVEVFEQTCIDTGADYNTTKLEYLAKSHVFLAVQGGGAHILSAFGNSVLLILHKTGLEYPHSYAKGPYKYLAEQPPTLLVVREHGDLGAGMRILAETRVTDEGAVIPASLMPVVERLSL